MSKRGQSLVLKARKPLSAVVLSASLCLLAGCGQKGSLYLPNAPKGKFSPVSSVPEAPPAAASAASR